MSGSPDLPVRQVRRSPVLQACTAMAVGLSLALIAGGRTDAALDVEAAEIVNKRHEKPAVAEVEWQKLSGRVEKKDAANRSLKIRDRNGNLASIIIDEHVQIFRDWRLVALNDVQINDRITLRHNTEGL